MHRHRFLAVSGRKVTAHPDRIHHYEPPDTVPQAGPVIMDMNLSFFPVFFLRRLHIMLTQCQSKTINIPNLAPIGRQVLLTIIAVNMAFNILNYFLKKLHFQSVFHGRERRIAHAHGCGRRCSRRGALARTALVCRDVRARSQAAVLLRCMPPALCAASAAQLPLKCTPGGLRSSAGSIAQLS